MKADFVGEGRALESSSAMLREAGTHYVIGYGGVLSVPAIDIISSEINVVGNLVGTYNDLAELMTVAAEGRVTLHTSTYPLSTRPTTPWTTSRPAACTVGAS